MYIHDLAPHLIPHLLEPLLGYPLVHVHLDVTEAGPRLRLDEVDQRMRLYLPFNDLRHLVGHLPGRGAGIVGHEDDLFDHKGRVLPFSQLAEGEDTPEKREDQEEVNDLFVP